VSVNLVPDFSGTRFWYGIEHNSIPSQKLSGTRHKPCNVKFCGIICNPDYTNKCYTDAQQFCAEALVPMKPGHQVAPSGVKMRAASVRHKSLPAGIASRHRSPTCYLHDGPSGNCSRAVPLLQAKTGWSILNAWRPG